jgi:small neutral amino acid transporter SnatA (MarC family)
MKREHMEICKRVGGILLVAIAIQMLTDSAKALLPGLAH